MKKFLWALVYVLGAFTGTVLAEDKPQTVIIFDASGSMWGQIDGKAKIEIARGALSKVINTWNPEEELGLTAYGHRSKGDCNDIQTLIPVGQVDKNRFISTVKNIQPKGKTPISRSLQKVADDTKFTEEKATIILISDGKETCDPDPCVTAKELEKKGIDFVTHVVGFNVDKQTDKQLQCIADATGGVYFSAKNAEALGDAMKSIVKQLKDNVEVIAVEEGGQWVDASHHFYAINDGEVDKKLKWCLSKKDRACSINIPEGEYIIRSKYVKQIKETHVQVKSNELNKIEIVMGSTGIAEVIASEEKGGKSVDAYHKFYLVIDDEIGKNIKRCTSKKKKICREKLPAGKYLIKSKYGKITQESRVELKAGETNKIEIVMGSTGTAEVIATEEKGGKWIKASHKFYPVTDGKVEKGYFKSCTSKKKKACIEKLPVGEYLIKSKYGKIKKETPLILTKGKLVKIEVVLNHEEEIKSDTPVENANVNSIEKDDDLQKGLDSKSMQ